MVMISPEVRSRIEKVGSETREIKQRGIPFNVRPGIPIANPFARKQLLFKTRYKLSGIALEDVRTGIFFGNFTSFMDMKMETYSRKRMTRHFKINPFTRKFEEILGGKFGKAGIRIGQAIASFMVATLGLVEWEMSEIATGNPDLACIHVILKSRFFGGHFKFRIHRQPDGVILDDDWLPDGGGDVRTSTLAMANLVLATHPLGFEQIAQRVVDEILKAKNQGCSYIGEIGPPSTDIG